MIVETSAPAVMYSQQAVVQPLTLPQGQLAYIQVPASVQTVSSAQVQYIQSAPLPSPTSVQYVQAASLAPTAKVSYVQAAPSAPVQYIVNR